MSRPLHLGRPGSSGAVPAGWAAAHAPVVTGTFDCTVRIGTAGGTPAWNEEAGQTQTPAVTAAYTGAASVGLLTNSDGTRREAAEDLVDERLYEVKIPAGQADVVEADHLVFIDTSPNPALVGAVLRVTSIALPGREFSRVLICALNT